MRLPVRDVGQGLVLLDVLVVMLMVLMIVRVMAARLMSILLHRLLSLVPALPQLSGCARALICSTTAAR